jgi:Kef-type K+ transport system membrane component KefB
LSHEELLLLRFAGILLLGIGAQWLAWRLRLPSILLLLAFGFLAGPTTVVKATRLTPEFDWAAFRERHGAGTLPLFVVSETGALVVCAADRPISPKPGQTVISLAAPVAADRTPSRSVHEEGAAS